MRRWTSFLVVSGAGLFLAAAAQAVPVAMPMPPANRAALADALVVGRVVAHEDKDVEISQAPGAPAVKHRVAVVSVTERVFGAKEAKTVRIAFIPLKGVDPVIGRPRPGLSPQLEIGADGLFYLAKHFKDDLYLIPMYYDFVARANPTFDKELAETRETAKLLVAPMDGLKAKDAEERFKTAALLITRYRTPRGGATRSEPIADDESKLILKAILESRWDAPQVFGKAHPWPTFLQLGLTAKDGWTPPAGAKSVADFHGAARVWLEKNGETYRIQRLVAGAAK